MQLKYKNTYNTQKCILKLKMLSYTPNIYVNCYIFENISLKNIDLKFIFKITLGLHIKKKNCNNRIVLNSNSLSI